MNVLLIGVGNEYRSDDAAGLIVARLIHERAPEQVDVREASGEGAALMEAWKGAQSVILVDAVRSGVAPGAIHRFEAHRRPLPARFFRHSTHAFSVAEAIELARALNQLPPRLIVYGIEGKEFASGLGLSPEANAAVQKVVERVLHEDR